MSLRPKAPSSPVLQVLLLLSLLLTVLVPSTVGKSLSGHDERHVELRCICLKITSSINPSNIQNLKVMRAGPYCPKVEVIAQMKNGKKICLDPEMPRIKKIVQKFLEGDESAA